MTYTPDPLRVATLDEVVRYGSRGGHRALRARGLRPPPIAGGAGITRDQALGSNSGSATNGIAGSLVITTGQIAAAASRIAVVVSWFDTGTGVFTVADSVGSYTKDKQVDNGGDHIAVFSRVLVGSLASTSSITVSWTAAQAGGGVLAGACSYLGTSGVDVTSSATGTTSTSWSSGSGTNSVADALFVGGAGHETTASTTSTPVNGTERFDLWLSSQQQGLVMQDLIATSVAAQALTGTLSSAPTSTTGALVVYKGTVPPVIAIPMTNVNVRMRAGRR